MKTISTCKLNLNTIAGHYFLIPVLILIFSLIIPNSVRAEKRVSYEGTLQGASCVHYKEKCPEDDAHIAIENDFVLLLPNGNHYFLPNLNRAIKVRYVAKSVRVNGKKEGHEIWVDSLAVKSGNEYRTVWTSEEQKKLYKGGGG